MREIAPERNKNTAHQAKLARVEAEIEKLLDILIGANVILLAYANKKIEVWAISAKHCPRRFQTCLLKQALSYQQIELLSSYLNDWGNIRFEDK